MNIVMKPTPSTCGLLQHIVNLQGMYERMHFDFQLVVCNICGGFTIVNRFKTLIRFSN